MDERASTPSLSPRSRVWARLLFVALFAVLYSLAEVVLAAVVILQFIILLVTGNTNARLIVFGRELSVYACQTWLYFTFNSDTRPFPFSDWPGADTTPVMTPAGHPPGS